MNLVDALRQKDSRTQNGAVTHSTSLSYLVDLFFMAGASRNKPEYEIESLLTKAFNENVELATKLVFWAGDIRGGAGERRFFQLALKFIKENYNKIYEDNIDNVPFYNRYDSLFQFTDKTTFDFLHTCLANGDSLLAKWLPREGKAKHQKFLKEFREYIELSPKSYRKLVAGLSKTVEQDLSARRFTSINYSHVPSVAFSKYKRAFRRNDEEGFSTFLDKVQSGEAKVNAGAIFPHDIYRTLFNDVTASVAQWNALPNYMENSSERILPVCDVSGSMHGTPMEISIALGLYISERNTGTFKDCFMTFSESPRMYKLQGDLVQRANDLNRAEWGYNTNLQALFRTILMAATNNNIPEEEMPTTVLIISDMEFDQACKHTNLEAIQLAYISAGYTIPKLVFWNVNSVSNSNLPARFNEEGVGLVSGASPSVIKAVLSGEISPDKVMLRTINDPRYDKIIVDIE